MRTVLKTVTLALLLALVSGCARHAVTDYDSSAGFDGYSTYRFAEKDEDSAQGLDAARIERALKKALADEGFTQVDAAPDVLMRYRIEDEVRTESRGPRLGFGFGFGRSPFTFGVAHSPVQTREIREGQLVVEMVDPNLEQIVWEGRGQRFLSESQDREERTELIERIIEAMFEQYPPR